MYRCRHWPLRPSTSTWPQGRAFRTQPAVAEDVLARIKVPLPLSMAPPLHLERSWTEMDGACQQGPSAWAERVQTECRHRTGLHNLGLPCQLLTSSVLRCFKPWQHTILSRHMCGAFMSGAEKSTWSRLDCQHCELCGELDSKHHRVHPPLVPADPVPHRLQLFSDGSAIHSSRWSAAACDQNK